ncbi:MAG: TolC family protein [Opitutae bacterium]
MNFLRFIIIFSLICLSHNVHGQQRTREQSTPTNYDDLEKKLRDIESKLSNLLQKIESVDHNKEGTLTQINSISSESNSSRDEVQTGWDLRMLRELALKNSPEILLKKAELRIDQKDIPIIKLERMPSLKGKISFDDYEKISQLETYSEPEPYNSFSYGIEGRWVLYNGHKNRKEINTAKYEVTRAELALQLEEQKVIKNLTSHFFNALSAQTQSDFLPKIELVSKEKLSIYNKKLKSGIVDSMFLNDSIRDLENIRAQILNSSHALELAKSEIGFIFNADDSFWFKYKKLIIPSDFKVKSNFDSENSTSSTLGQVGIKIAKSKYDEIETGYSPVLELIGSVGHRSRNKIGFDNTGQELTLGMSLTLPITDRFITRRKLERAQEEMKKAEYEKLRLVTRQKNEFKSEFLRLKQTKRNLEFQKEMLGFQKKRLTDMMTASARGIYDRSNILMEEEKLLQREMYVELTRISYIKQKYQLDLIE